MDDRRDWKLHHAVRVVRAYLPGGFRGIFLRVAPQSAEIPTITEASTSTSTVRFNPSPFFAGEMGVAVESHYFSVGSR
jgi:hypothetical protein